MPELRLTMGTAAAYPGGVVVNGGTGSVDDDSDASYVRYTLDGAILYPPESTNYHWTPAPADIPNFADTTDRGARFRIRASLEGSVDPDEARRFVVLDGTTFATWIDHSYNPTASIAWTTQQDATLTSTQWAKFQTGDVSVEPVGDGSAYAANLYEVELILWWTRRTKAPPCRITGRADNLGSGSGRIWPPPNTHQSSNRRGGGSTY